MDKQELDGLVQYVKDRMLGKSSDTENSPPTATHWPQAFGT